MSHPIDDDEEESLDFVFDGTIRAPHQQTATRPKVEVLRQAVAEYRSGDGSLEALETILASLERSVGEVIQDCDRVMREDPERRSFLEENLIVYQTAFEAVQRMQTACQERRMDWMEQGLTTLEAAVADVNALVAQEEELKKGPS